MKQWDKENMDNNVNQEEFQIEQIEERIKEAGRNLKIPEGLSPEKINQKLNDTKKVKNRKRKIYTSLATAAMLALVCGTSLYFDMGGINNPSYKGQFISEEGIVIEETKRFENYHDIYKKLRDIRGDNILDYLGINEIFDTVTIREEAKVEFESSAVTDEMSDMSSGMASKTSENKEVSYSKTNTQVKEVDEADIVKTDGTYIYRLNTYKGQLDIISVDKGTMNKVSEIEFYNPQEFYIQNDKLIMVTQGSIDMETETYESEIKQYVTTHYYDISDRNNPKFIHKLTQSGYYKTSRIYDNYLYMLTNQSDISLEKRSDISKYIPQINEEAVTPDKIFIPDGSNSLSYLNITSTDIENAKEFKDHTSVISTGDNVYMNTENLYIIDSKWHRDQKDLQYDTSSILKFSIKEGTFKNVGETTIKGKIMDPFSMDEYEGNLRIVTTVNHYKQEKIYDDLNKKYIGKTSWESTQDNSVYVLDKNLKQIGKIEGLAEDERIYSARFMGEYGYFVTFRETDPLFSVDLSNPNNPKIMEELKIPGFSEYLHFYDEGLLLGIGQEISETGSFEGVKLSMFDITDPTDVKEKDKLVLKGYFNSSALYDYKSVMIDTERNLFGFNLEGGGRPIILLEESMVKEDLTESKILEETETYEYGEEYRNEYCVFTYDKEKGFLCKLFIPQGDRYNMRGIYIEDTLYVVQIDSDQIKAYDINSKEKVGEYKGKN